MTAISFKRHWLGSLRGNNPAENPHLLTRSTLRHLRVAADAVWLGTTRAV